jgi:hypothetical protein
VGELPQETPSSVLTHQENSKISKPKRRKKSKPKKYELSEEAQKFIKSCRDPELKRIARRLLPLFAPESVSSEEHSNNTREKDSIESSRSPD